MTRPSTERPALRALDAHHVTAPSEGFALHDRLGISAPAFVPMGLVPIVRRLDGTRTLATIRREVATETGDDVTLPFVLDVVRQLDELVLLAGARFDGAITAAADALLAADARPPRHAGSAGYPAEPNALRMALQAMVRGPHGPPTPLRGLVAPHIDLARGRAGYRAAYERLCASPPAELYVLFGTGHAGPQAPVTGLALDWCTPLGRVATDTAFVAAVHDKLGGPTPHDVLLHRDEHSLEFQVLLLQHAHELRGLPPPRVAAFLCGALPSATGDPLQEGYVNRLLEAFRDAGAGRGVVFVAGADLAHVGPDFGDPQPITDAQLRALELGERRHLQHLVAGAPGAFHGALHCTGNRDRVCSAPAITLCATLAGGPGELLHYGQARAADDRQTVTFCAMAFPG